MVHDYKLSLLSLNFPKRALIRERTIENHNAGQNPVTSKPSTIFEASIIKRALITKEKSPKVMIVSGRARIFTTGLIKIFIIPKTIAKTIEPKRVTVTPGTKYVATIMANAETIR